MTEPIDTREPHGQFVAELLVAQARMESANTAARQRRKAREQKEQGLPPTNGRRCFGYERGYAHQVPEEAAILREVKDRILAGESLRSVTLDLEARAVVGTQGSAWRAHILKRLLVSPTIAGLRCHEGQLLPGSWKPIISPDEHQRLKSVLNRRPGAQRLSPARKRLLTGFLRCGRCAGRIVAQPGTRGRYEYVKKQAGYPNCGKLSVVGEPLEELVAEVIFAAVDDEALAQALQARGEADDGLVEAIRRDESALETLSRDFYVDQLISREEFFAARSELNARLEANRGRLAKRNGSGTIGRFVGESGALRSAWKSGSLEWRRSVIGALIEHIVIGPGRPGRQRLDPSRVTPVWRY